MPVSGFADRSQLIPPMALVKAGPCNLGTLRVTGSKELESPHNNDLLPLWQAQNFP